DAGEYGRQYAQTISRAFPRLIDEIKTSLVTRELTDAALATLNLTVDRTLGGLHDAIEAHAAVANVHRFDSEDLDDLRDAPFQNLSPASWGRLRTHLAERNPRMCVLLDNNGPMHTRWFILPMYAL